MTEHVQKLNGSGERIPDDQQPSNGPGGGDKEEDKEEEQTGQWHNCGDLGAFGNRCNSCEYLGFIYDTFDPN
jgi:hypothetical protein